MERIFAHIDAIEVAPGPRDHRRIGISRNLKYIGSACGCLLVKRIAYQHPG
jgi:hypothetical protein